MKKFDNFDGLNISLLFSLLIVMMAICYFSC